MKIKTPGLAVSKIGHQAAGDGAESQFVPWDIFFGEQPSLQAFGAGRKVSVEKSCTVKQVNLINMRDADQREQGVDFSACAGFLERFPEGGLLRRFAVFHKSRRQGPQSMGGFDGPAAEQDVAFPFGNAADHQLGITIMDRFALRTDMARQHIVRGDAEFDEGAALGTELHSGEPIFMLTILYDNSACGFGWEIPCALAVVVFVSPQAPSRYNSVYQ